MRLVVSKRQIALYLASFILLWLNAGNFEYIGGHIPSIIKFGMVLLWIFFAMGNESLTMYLKQIMPILVLIALVIFSRFVGRTDYYRLYFMGYMYFAVLLAIGMFYFFNGTKEEIKFLLIVFFLDFVIESVHTGYELINNPIVVRAMSTDAATQMKLLDQAIPKGIGNYSWTYQLAFVAPLIIDLLDKTHKTVFRVIKYVVIVAMFLWLIQAQITLAMILFVFLTFFSMLLKRSEGNKGMGIKLALLVLGILFAVNIYNILEFLISISNVDIANRLTELLNIIRYGNAASQSDTGSRLRLYAESLNAFLSNPVWGNFGSKPFGCHSTVLDLLAAYGICGFLGIMGLFKPLNVYRKNSNIIQFSIIVLFFVLLASINMVIDSAIFLVIYVILPLGYRYINYPEYEEALE